MRGFLTAQNRRITLDPAPAARLAKQETTVPEEAHAKIAELG
jgi:hypothetical protein